MRIVTWTIFPLLCLFSTQGYARPEYALRYNINRCTTCHVSPVGGGPRILTGKLFGGRSKEKPNQFSQQDLVDIELYLNYFHPERPEADPGGLGVMALNIAGNIPIQESDTKDIRLLAEHNIGGFPGGTGGPRSTYLRFKNYADTENHWKPQYILIGRFSSPFGIITDEHRTYTKVLTGSTWLDFETGALFSGQPTGSLHYDLALANGQRNSGNFGAGNANNWGGVANIRYMPESAPLFLGLSTSYHETQEETPSTAGAIYAMLSLDRITRYRVNGEILAEYVEAKRWNSGLSDWISNMAYLDALRPARSQGWWAQATYNFNEYWSALYKYDEMVPDRDFPSDYFRRHGFGINYRWREGGLLRLRHETANATHPSENNREGQGAQDVSWIVFNFWI